MVSFVQLRIAYASLAFLSSRSLTMSVSSTQTDTWQNMQSA